MSRFLFVIILSVFAADTHAQNADSSLVALDAIYQKMHTANEKPTDKSLEAIQAGYKSALPLLDNAARSNSVAYQNAGRFMEALLKYELGFANKSAGQKQKAHDIYLDDAKVFESVKHTAQFPLEFTYNNIIHTFTKSSFDEQYYQFYSSFGGLCTNMDKFEEAKTYLLKALENPDPELYFTYQISTTLWSAKRQTKQADSEYVSFTLQALKSWARTDKATKDTISKHRYYAVSAFAGELIYIIPQAADLKNKAMAYLTAAYYLDSTRQDNALDFYWYAMHADSSSRAVLWQIDGYAKRTGNNDLLARAESNIARVYANEPDEAVRNLGAALQEIVPDASDSTRHLMDIRGRSFNVKNIGGKNYKSSVQLKGAMVSYTHEFLKNNQHNYYYWDAIIDDEKPANLQGKLSARYKALCEETRNLYPQSHIFNRYAGLNSFVAEVNRYVTIEISYFNNGANDRIIYSVSSEMGKDVK